MTAKMDASARSIRLPRWYQSLDSSLLPGMEEVSR